MKMKKLEDELNRKIEEEIKIDVNEKYKNEFEK